LVKFPARDVCANAAATTAIRREAAKMVTNDPTTVSARS